MLHKCQSCPQIYLVSEFHQLCNVCGEYLKQRIERVYEDDGAEEWWRICAQAMFNDYSSNRMTQRMAVATVVSVLADPHAR